MSESQPPAERPPMATRAVPKTVRVRAADYQRDPDDEPTGPPKVLFWFRLGCAVVAVVAFCFASFAAVDCVAERWYHHPGNWLAWSLVVFAAYSLPLWFRRPRWWHWIYGLALMLPGIVPLTNPLSVILLVFWCRPKTIRFFRDPRSSYAVEKPTPVSADATPLAEPPGVLFALRWLCLLGCGACLLAMPVTAAVFAADPNGGWGAVWWLGGFAAGFLLFVVPLFARTPRRWVWWYGFTLLVLCSLSGYFTLLAVPTLAFWLLNRPREYFANNGLVNPGSHAGGASAPQVPP